MADKNPKKDGKGGKGKLLFLLLVLLGGAGGGYWFLAPAQFHAHLDQLLGLFRG